MHLKDNSQLLEWLYYSLNIKFLVEIINHNMEYFMTFIHLVQEGSITVEMTNSNLFKWVIYYMKYFINCMISQDIEKYPEFITESRNEITWRNTNRTDMADNPYRWIPFIYYILINFHLINPRYYDFIQCLLMDMFYYPFSQIYPIIIKCIDDCVNNVNVREIFTYLCENDVYNINFLNKLLERGETSDNICQAVFSVAKDKSNNKIWDSFVELVKNNLHFNLDLLNQLNRRIHESSIPASFLSGKGTWDYKDIEHTRNLSTAINAAYAGIQYTPLAVSPLNISAGPYGIADPTVPNQIIAFIRGQPNTRVTMRLAYLMFLPKLFLESGYPSSQQSMDIIAAIKDDRAFTTKCKIYFHNTYLAYFKFCSNMNIPIDFYSSVMFANIYSQLLMFQFNMSVDVTNIRASCLYIEYVITPMYFRRIAIFNKTIEGDLWHDFGNELKILKEYFNEIDTYCDEFFGLMVTPNNTIDPTPYLALNDSTMQSNDTTRKAATGRALNEFGNINMDTTNDAIIEARTRMIDAIGTCLFNSTDLIEIDKFKKLIKGLFRNYVIYIYLEYVIGVGANANLLYINLLYILNSIFPGKINLVDLHVFIGVLNQLNLHHIPLIVFWHDNAGSPPQFSYHTIIYPSIDSGTGIGIVKVEGNINQYNGEILNFNDSKIIFKTNPDANDTGIHNSQGSALPIIMPTYSVNLWNLYNVYTEVISENIFICVNYKNIIVKVPMVVISKRKYTKTNKISITKIKNLISNLQNLQANLGKEDFIIEIDDVTVDSSLSIPHEQLMHIVMMLVIMKFSGDLIGNIIPHLNGIIGMADDVNTYNIVSSLSLTSRNANNTSNTEPLTANVSWLHPTLRTTIPPGLTVPVTNIYMGYIQKYLKYKNKYLQLKNPNHKILTEKSLSKSDTYESKYLLYKHFSEGKNVSSLDIWRAKYLKYNLQQVEDVRTDIFYKKYLLYKQKYLKLKNSI